MAIYLLDLDGTMYHGKRIVPAVKTLVDYLTGLQQRFYFLTNNASRTPQENAQHMADIGFTGIKAEQFFNSAMACVRYTKENFSGRRVMMVGQEGLAYELSRHGFILVKQRADFVMVGLNQQADYQLYSLALQNLLDGAKLLATNSDRVLMSEEGTKIGNGSVVAMLEYASGQQAVSIGKPNPIFMEEALAYFGLNKEEVVVVGDNLETDIAGGLAAGLKTVFVLGGVHKVEDIDRLKIVPDRVISSLFELI